MLHRRPHFRVAGLLLTLTAHTVVLDAQTPPEPAPQAPQAPQTTTSAPANAAVEVIQRWFDVPAANLMLRYRRVESSEGFVNANHMQDGFLLRARLKFDRAGHYAVNAGIATGPTFTGAWNNTGWGTGGARTTGVYMKQIFFAATPVTGLDLSYGSLSLVRGESTEITTFDNDGYMTGLRATIKRPADVFLDDITVTEGYLGDLAWPSFWDRYNRLGDWNYLHVLAGKKIAHGAVAVSGDYTYLAGVNVYRGAASVKTPRLYVIDSVRYEQYCRTRSLDACGFATTLDKALNKHVTLSGGYADIDQNYGNTNADRFLRGRRFFELVSVKVLRDAVVSAFGTQAVNNDFVVPNGHRFDLVLTYNALGPLQRAGLFR